MSKKIMKMSLFLSILIFVSCSWGGGKKDKNMLSEEAVLKIAEANLHKTYGDEVLKQKPFKATLKGNVWRVVGTLHCPQGEVCKGGTAIIEISAKDGTVIHTTHEK